MTSVGLAEIPQSVSWDGDHTKTPPVQLNGEFEESLSGTAQPEFAHFESCATCSRDEELDAFSVGASVYFAKPHVKEAFQANILNVQTGTSQLIPLDNDYQASPKLWIAYQVNESFGVRASYWQYDHQSTPFSQAATQTQFPGANVVTIIFPATITTSAPGEVLRVDNSLKFETVDLEATMPIRLGSLQVTGGAGIRYASMMQSFNAIASGVFPTRSLNWTRDFEGTGLTMGADVRKPIISGLSVIADAQLSLLFVEKKLNRSVIGDVTPNSPPANVTLDDADEISATFELGIGLEWKTALTDQTDVFLQGKYESSIWTAAGQPTLSFLGFQGLTGTAGLNW
ncbi:MAG: hypothetical protein KDM63_04880 [Verrucomicrobiae bacterium]|nr:hypothetical protein [Verrucomicrobiae bacterium]